MKGRRKIQDINLPNRGNKINPRKKKPLQKKTASAVKNKTLGRPKKGPSESAISRGGSNKKRHLERRMRSRSPIVEVNGGHDAGTRILGFVAMILLIVLSYVLSLSFSKASIQVFLKEESHGVDTLVELFQDGVDNQVDFDTVVLKEKTEKIITTSESTLYSEKSSGRIVIYNNHSSKSQRFIEETRFEDPEGRIYKTAKGESVIVPGTREVDGKIVPGSVEVMVYASEPGDYYNQKETDFVVPGLRGGAKFEGFYARSITPLSGGVTEERPVLSSETKENLLEQLQDSLEEKSKNALLHRIPDGYFIVPGGANYKWSPVDFSKKEDNTYSASQTVEVLAVIIKEDELSWSLIKDLDYEEDIQGIARVINLEDLSYDFSQDSEESVALGVKGEIIIRWGLEGSKIKNLVSGVRKKDLASVLKKREEIQSVKSEIKPSWASRLPKSTEKIKVIFGNIDS